MNDGMAPTEPSNSSTRSSVKGDPWGLWFRRLRALSWFWPLLWMSGSSLEGRIRVEPPDRVTAPRRAPQSPTARRSRIIITMPTSVAVAPIT